VANALGNLDSMVRNTGARVTWEALPVVRGHAAPLLSIFQNLIGNGVKYHADGREPVVSIRAARREREWLLTVEDNGIGIEPEYHQRIFGVFKRLHPAKYPGTGIGLALCSRLLEGRGGTIWVESEPGRGSRFCLTIPDR
jgi:light-regulated signal transduction histidine kinase (bacteriophytochrome)